MKDYPSSRKLKGHGGTNTKCNILIAWYHPKNGDIVLIEYKSKSFPGTYRTGRVKHVTLDLENLVRTCSVTYKLMKSSVTTLRNIHKDITTKEITVPVQRLILILPVEEQ